MAVTYQKKADSWPMEVVEAPSVRRSAWPPATRGDQPALVIRRSAPQTTSMAAVWAQAQALHGSGAGAPASTITWIEGPISRW